MRSDSLTDFHQSPDSWLSPLTFHSGRHYRIWFHQSTAHPPSRRSHPPYPDTMSPCWLRFAYCSPPHVCYSGILPLDRTAGRSSDVISSTLGWGGVSWSSSLDCWSIVGVSCLSSIDLLWLWRWSWDSVSSRTSCFHSGSWSSIQWTSPGSYPWSSDWSMRYDSRCCFSSSRLRTTDGDLHSALVSPASSYGSQSLPLSIGHQLHNSTVKNVADFR